jgi:hypothetical protein
MIDNQPHIARAAHTHEAMRGGVHAKGVECTQRHIGFNLQAHKIPSRKSLHYPFQVAFMPSFDTVLEPDLVEVRNACDQASKEIATRFDFKGSSAQVELADKTLTLTADSDFQLAQVRDVLMAKAAKRKIDPRFFDLGKIEKISGDKVKQVITVKAGIPQDLAKKITAAI